MLHADSIFLLSFLLHTNLVIEIGRFIEHLRLSLTMRLGQ